MKLVRANMAPRFRRWRLPSINPPLLIGCMLVSIIVFCAVAAPWIAPADPQEAQIRFEGTKLVPVPYPPGTQGMLLGSDTAGRDMLSRLIYGSRYTLLFCAVAAVVRLAIGIGIGMLAGWYPRLRRITNTIVGMWSALPSLLVAIIAIPVFLDFGGLAAPGLVGFVFVLSITGWPETAVFCQTVVQSLRSAMFVEAAYSIGLTRWAVLWRHVLPNLRDVIFIEAAALMGGALLLVGELGFLQIFVGGGQQNAYYDNFPDPIYAEWGSMLAQGMSYRSRGIWMTLEPLIAFTVTILAFNLVAEGLRRQR